jgi:hypothetical protein
MNDMILVLFMLIITGGGIGLLWWVREHEKEVCEWFWKRGWPRPKK